MYVMLCLLCYVCYVCYAMLCMLCYNVCCATYVMLCYVCYVVLCHVMYAMLCTLCYACYAMYVMSVYYVMHVMYVRKPTKRCFQSTRHRPLTGGKRGQVRIKRTRLEHELETGFVKGPSKGDVVDNRTVEAPRRLRAVRDIPVHVRSACFAQHFATQSTREQSGLATAHRTKYCNQLSIGDREARDNKRSKLCRGVLPALV
jgi:hypothetical protein